MASKYSGATKGPQFDDKLKPAGAEISSLIDLIATDNTTEDVLNETYERLKDPQLYSDAVDEQFTPSVEDTDSLYQPDVQGEPAVPRNVASNIGNLQKDFSEDRMQLFGESEYDANNLDPAIEDALIEQFARLKGVDTFEIENNPLLFDELGRYLGAKTKTLVGNRYNAYERTGADVKASGPVPTAFRQVTRLFDLNREKDPTFTSMPDNEVAIKARGDREKIVQKLVDYGTDKVAAEKMWDKATSQDNTESPIRSALFSLSPGKDSKADFKFFTDGLLGMSDKVTRSLQQTFTRLGPKQQEMFVKKIIENNPDFSRADLQQTLYALSTSYGAVAAQEQNFGRFMSDIFLLTVMDEAKTKMVRYETERSNTEDANMAKMTTAEATAANESKLMLNVNDDISIGRKALAAMFFPNATQEQMAMVGAIAKVLVSDAFTQQEGDPNDISTPLYENKLFERTFTPDVTSDNTELNNSNGEPRSKVGFTLTAKGLDVADRLQPMFNMLLPDSKRKVRYAKKPNKVGDIVLRKLGKKTEVGATPNMKSPNTEGEIVSIGETKEMAEMKTVAENTPVTINSKMQKIYNEIFEDLQSFLNTIRNNELDDNSRAAYQTTVMAILDGAAFQNIKGDSNNNRGAYGFRPGVVLQRNEEGRFVREDGSITDIADEAAVLFDASDRIKDSLLFETKTFIEENVGKTFMYDYFYGLGTRLNVDQTVGNYQSSKAARAVINASEEATYYLNKAQDVITLKAGIMKRFGYDKMDVLTAADLFDSQVLTWINADLKQKLTIASNEEGWASVAAIEEGIAFHNALVNPNGTGVYKTGFYTEIDGLTNGMAHSAVQAGDRKTAWGANIFDPATYEHWARNYDMIEELTRNKQIDDLINLEDEHGDSLELVNYLDAYNSVNQEMLNQIRRLKGTAKDKSQYPDIDVVNVGLPGMLSKMASNAAQVMMRRAHGAGSDGRGQGSKLFLDALDILDDTGNSLGRKFIKKPVMIFGYGAGEARIGEAVRMFVEDMFVQNPSLRQQFQRNGIDLNVNFIDPLSKIAAEAVNQQFSEIKKFATTLSTIATDAARQGFAMKIPTQAGYFINLGGKVYEIDRGKGRTKSFRYYPGDVNAQINLDKAKEKLKAGQKLKMSDTKSRSQSSLMISKWQPFFLQGDSLKAATQITVMLNHANDNINMMRSLVNLHKARLAKEDGVLFDSTVTRHKNNALHIFDGLLVTPKEAETHATELNNVFGQMMRGNRNKTGVTEGVGHAGFVEDALTYELNGRGEKIIDNYSNNLGDRSNIPSKIKEKHKFVRLLNAEGKAIRAAQHPDLRQGSWHPELDEYAYDWEATEASAQALQDLRNFDKARRDLENSSHILQFFWSTRPVHDLINRADPARIAKHTIPNKKIMM